MAFLVHFPGIPGAWVVDPGLMPHSLWLAARDYVDRKEGRV